MISCLCPCTLDMPKADLLQVRVNATIKISNNEFQGRTYVTLGVSMKEILKTKWDSFNSWFIVTLPPLLFNLRTYISLYQTVTVFSSDF